ncbi:hypothetical protein [Streptomyces sp. NPDC093269]|uniref:hypothetical protein n=1 Tax=Streptomyces sp. NPDC093269 TaxID=3366038 RepID=UPI003808E662
MCQSPARVIVLAKSLREFHAWCQATGRSPRNPHVVYAAGPSVLRRAGEAEIVQHGEWWERLDAPAMADALAALTATTAVPVAA